MLLDTGRGLLGRLYRCLATPKNSGVRLAGAFRRRRSRPVDRLAAGAHPSCSGAAKYGPRFEPGDKLRQMAERGETFYGTYGDAQKAP